LTHAWDYSPLAPKTQGDASPPPADNPHFYTAGGYPPRRLRAKLRASMPDRHAWTSALLGAAAASVACLVSTACMRTPAPNTRERTPSPAASAPPPKPTAVAPARAVVAPQLARAEPAPAPLPASSTALDAKTSAARFAEGYVDSTRCTNAPEPPRTLSEAGVAKQFSVDGYAARTLAVEGTDAGQKQLHCLTVAWPSGATNSDGKPVRVAHAIDTAWFEAIENTLARLPWSHVVLVQRIVIDNRPTEHGIAAFDRQDPADARDGHSVWLHEHLFLAKNHWAHGNYGSYWGYHVNEDGRVIDNAGPDHDLFSPILLHEIGHLVMYWIANAHLTGPEAASNVECANTCKDRGDCRELDKAERERGCVSPYCAPFRFEASTENWAEQYRLFYQSSASRTVLERSDGGCLALLTRGNEELAPPWQRGLPDIASYRRSLWDSCGGRACKAW